MKKLLLFFLLTSALMAKAQIVLEHAHDSASVRAGGSGQLMIIDFEVSGERYVKVNRMGKTIQIYELNHTLVKSISYASFPQAPNNVPYVLYISETLFDPDPAIEFMYIVHDANGSSHTSIYKEDGDLLFYEDNASPWIVTNVPLQQYPIYNTGQGTKMILSDALTHQAYVYSLPGTLSLAIHQTNAALMEESGLSVSNAYPNPTRDYTTIDYVLPQDAAEGEIIFYDMNGREVRRFRVDHAFSSLLVSTAELPAGNYLYHLQVQGDASAAKRMVVIK